MFCSLNDRPTATPAQQTGESTVASKSKYLSAKSKQKQKPNSKPADSAPANLSLNNALEQGREISREMEVQNCLVEFRRILHLQRKQSINSIAPEESQPIKEGYARLITNRVLQISLPEVQSVQDSPIHALQFVVHKNYSILVEQDHPELAQTLLLKTVKIDPSSSQAWCRLGNVSMKLKDHSLAVAAFQHALQVCQTQIEYWLSLKGLCEATFEIGDFEACIPLIQLAKSINPDYTLADAMRIEIMNESRFELPFDSSAQQTRLRNSVKKAPAKKLVPRITVRLNEAELSWILFADTLIDVYRDGLGGPVLFILDDFRGNKIETVTSGNELAMFADADYNGKEKELMDTEMDTENPKYQEINDKTVETNSPDTPSIESDENNYGQEGGDNKTAKDTITKTSPTKRKKRFRDLEARTSKRIKEETTASNAALLIPTSGKAIALDNDLVSDQDFFETTENIIPETVAFTIKFQPRSRHSGKHTFQNTLVQSFDEFERVIKGFTIRIGGIVGDHTGNTGSDCRDGIIDTTQSGNLDFESNQSMEHSISHQDPFNKNTIKSYIESLNINRLNLTAFEIACGFIKFLFGGIYTATTNPAVLKIDNELLSVQMMATKESVKKWPEGLKSRVVAILLLLERGNCGSCLIFTNAVGGVDGFNNCEFENSVLSICELLFDYIVELKRELVPDTVQIAEVTGLLEAWWSVLKIPLTTGLAIYNDDCFLILRKDWLEGQMCEFFLQFEKAVDLYKTCLEIISAQNVPPLLLTNCENNAKIQANTLRTRIQSLSLEKHLQDSETASNAENHVTVLQNLHCLLFQDNSFSTWFSALLEIKVGPRRQHSVSIRLVLSVAQRIRILKMLLKAYDYLDMMTELFVCRVFLVISQVKYLLESNNFKEAFAEVSDFVVDVSEHCLVIVILKDNNAMLPILDFMGYPNSDAVYLEWTGCVFSLVRMAWEVVKCRDQQNDPAFVNFAIRSWSIMYFLCKSFEHDAKKAGVRLCKSSLEWIEFAHSQLGEVSICGGDNSSLLDLTVRACLKAKDGESMTELYQGFCCKYAITCTVDSSHPLMEHNNKPIEITVEDAAAIFIPLSKFVMKKLAAKENRAITNDLRDTVDTISEKFDEPPWNNGSRSLIDQFLASGIHKKHARPLPTLDYQANMSHFDVYKNLFFVRGRLACLQKRIVIGIKTKKSFENLELAGEEYLFNVYMNPRSPGAWILLAEVYSSLCDEYLSWSAFDIISNLELIRGYQLSAYHCFEQAVCLIRFRKLALLKDTQIEHQSSAEQIMSLWGNFGYLCYAIVIPPMKGIALKSSQLASDSLWSERYLEMTKLVDANVSNLNLELEGRKSIILRGIQCFKTAFKLNPKEWRYPFMVAKMSAKLDDISSKTTVEYFSQAISLVPKNWQTKEQETILDAHYCLASYLCKCLHSRKLEPNFVIRCLDKHSLGSIVTEETCDDYNLATTAYQRILREMSYMKNIDKKKWQHRPYWKSYWIWKTVFGDFEKAKAELLSIFQLKSNARGFINFWRTEFERPGRHFAYIHKYTLALISVLRQTKDLESMRHLVRKVQKAYDTLLYPQTVWKAGFEAMAELLAENVQESIWEQFIRFVPQKEFLALAPVVEKKMLWSNNEDRTEDASLLHMAFHLKKLNESAEDETLLSQILVQFYCKLFLTNMNFANMVEQVEPLSQDSSVYFTMVLRRCLIACKMPWNKRVLAEENTSKEPENGAEVSAEYMATVNEDGGNSVEEIATAVNTADINSMVFNAEEASARLRKAITDAEEATTELVTRNNLLAE